MKLEDCGLTKKKDGVALYINALKDVYNPQRRKRVRQRESSYKEIWKNKE